MLLHHQRRQSRHHHFCACSCLNDFNADDKSSVETHKWNGILSTVSEGFVLLFPRGLWPLLPPPPKFHRPFSLHHTLLQLPFPLALIPSHPTAISSPISLYCRHHCVPSFLYLLPYPSQLPRNGCATTFPPTPAAQVEDPRHRDGASFSLRINPCFSCQAHKGCPEETPPRHRAKPKG